MICWPFGPGDHGREGVDRAWSLRRGIENILGNWDGEIWDSRALRVQGRLGDSR
jgi:hypothetical protein